MSDPTHTDFPITINGKDYKLRYSIPSLWAYQDKTGIDLLAPDPRAATEDGRAEMAAEYAAKPVRERMKQTISLLWAGLIANHPNVTLEQISADIFLKDFPEIEAKVAEAFRASFPPAVEGDEERPTTAAN